MTTQQLRELHAVVVRWQVAFGVMLWVERVTMTAGFTLLIVGHQASNPVFLVSLLTWVVRSLAGRGVLKMVHQMREEMDHDDG